MKSHNTENKGEFMKPPAIATKALLALGYGSK
jgi:hypothetical protein